MTRKEQNKILDDKIESNINQYKVDRLNAEILAFSSGDLNKYDFLKRTDLNYKPNALDKATFEFSPLGKTFSTGLDKNVQGYQEGATKLLKDIRDSLKGGVRLPGPDNNDNNNDDDNNDDDNDDDNNDDDNDDDNNNDDNNDDNHYDNDDNDYDNRPKNKRYDNRVFLNNLNTNLNNIQNDSEHYARLIAYQNITIGKLKEELTDKKNLTQDIVNQAKETIDENNKEHLKYYNKYKNTLVDYTNALEQLNKAENTYGREIGNLRNEIQNLENAEKNPLETINELSDRLDELENKNISENDKEILLAKIDSLIDNNNRLEDFINNYDNNVKKSKYKIYNELNNFKNNMEDDMNNFNEKFTIKENKLNARFDKLNNYVEKLNNYIKENNDKIINTENKLDNANNEHNNLLLEYNRLNEEFIKIKDDLHKTKNKPNESEKIKKELNYKNNEIIKN